VFNPATNYTQWQAAFSSINGRTYRRKTAGTSATDPSADPTNWAETNPLSGNSTGALNLLKGSDIASSTTPDIWQAASGNVIGITGTTTTTGFATAPQAGAHRWLRAAGAWPLTHGANLVLPNATNYTCAAGDYLLVHAKTTTSFDVIIFKADGSPAGREGWVLLGTAVASSSASVAFTTGINSTYDEYVLEILNFIPASVATLRLRTSADGGSTYATTAADYHTAVIANTVGTPTPAGSGGVNETYIAIGNPADNTSVQGGVCASIRFCFPHLTAYKKQFNIQGSVMTNSSTELCNFFGSSIRNSASIINALQLSFSTGNIAAGTARLYGIKKS
jgi:hypothetical protein